MLFYEVTVVFLCRIQHEGHRRKNPRSCRSSPQEVLVTNNMAICTNAPPACACLQPFTTALQQVTILHFSVRCPVGPLFHPGSLDDDTVGFIFPSGWVNERACTHTAQRKSYYIHWFSADDGKSVCFSPEIKHCPTEREDFVRQAGHLWWIIDHSFFPSFPESCVKYWITFILAVWSLSLCIWSLALNPKTT